MAYLVSNHPGIYGVLVAFHRQGEHGSFFLGAFDMAVTRFSGRTAPPHPGAANLALFVAVEAYSHEVSSCGFWPGGGHIDEPVFYAYAYPEPPGFRECPSKPEEAYLVKILTSFYCLMKRSELQSAMMTY